MFHILSFLISNQKKKVKDISETTLINLCHHLRKTEIALEFFDLIVTQFLNYQLI